jgi:hypothetical protein
MFRPAVLLCAVVLLFSFDLEAGWFSDTDFYIIVQKTPSGASIDGWIVQGPPKNDNGIYIFTIYGTKIEKRVSIQGTIVTKIGPKWDDARKMLRAEMRAPDDPDRFKGF